MALPVSSSLEKPRYITAVVWPVVLVTIGSLDSLGIRYLTELTLASTSVSAWLGSKFSLMKTWIRSADAPGYTVVTLTTVFDSFGYCRIGSTAAARRPIKRISKLTTTDNTGRLMKISVRAIVAISF